MREKIKQTHTSKVSFEDEYNKNSTEIPKRT
jgi:hypothetical protein